MNTANYLNPRSVTLEADTSSVHLRVVIEGDRCIPAARVFRCFPLTAQDEYLSIQDGAGHEHGVLKNLDGLDPSSQATLAQYMNRRYFTPIIQRILTLNQEASMWSWEVVTQRGVATFYIRGVRDSVHEVAPRRWQIHSIDGQRFEIRDFEELDAKSKDLFEGLF